MKSDGLPEYYPQSHQPADPRNVVIIGVLIVVAVLVFLFLAWYSTWSCGPGKGPCSWAMSTPTEISILIESGS